MTKIGEIYVEVAGDITQYQKDMRALKADAKASGTDISNALNNAISPTQAVKNITILSDQLTKLANVAKTPASQFKAASESIASNLGDLAKKAGLTEKQFAELNERMMKKSAYQNAERSLLGIAKASGMSAEEAKKLALQMGYSAQDAEKMTAKLRDATGTTDKLAMAKKGLTIAAAAAGAALAVIGTVMVSSVKAAVEAEAAERKLEAVLKSTGYAAGFTSEQLVDMAQKLSRVSAVEDDLIVDSMAMLATFKNIRGEGFEAATQAALDMSAVMNQDLKSSIVQIGKALNDPIKGMTALTKVGVSFTDQQKDQVKALLAVNDVMGAQQIILDELKSEFGGAAEAMGDTFGGASKRVGIAFGNLKEEIGFTITKTDEFKDALVIVEGLLVDLATWVRDNRDEIAGVFKRAAEAVDTWAVGIGVIKDKLVELSGAEQSEADRLRAAIKLHKELAENKGTLAEWQIIWSAQAQEEQKELNKLLGITTQETKKTGETIKNEVAPAVVSLGDAEDKAAAAAKRHTDELNRLIDKYIPLKAAADNYTKAEAGLEELRRKGIISVDEYEAGLKNLKEQTDKATGAQKEFNKAIYDTGKSYDVMLPEFMAGTDELTKHIQDTTEKGDELWQGHTDNVLKLQEELVNDLGNILDGFINDVLTGEIDSIEDLFKGLFDSILNMFSRLLSQMAANSLIDALFGAGASGGLTLGSLFGSASGGAGLLGSLFSGGSSIGSLFGGGGLLGALGLGGSGLLPPTIGAGAVGAIPIATMPWMTAAPTVGAGAAAGGAGAAGAAGSMAWMGPAAIGALGLGLWINDVFLKEEPPPLSELLNNAGIGPEAFAAVVGDTFREMQNPVTGAVQKMMMDNESLILSIKHVNQSTSGMYDTGMQYFNQATGQWEDLSKAVLAFEITASHMGKEAAAAMLEAKTGVVGLAEEFMDIAEAEKNGLTKAMDAMEDMGIEGEDLHDVLDTVGDMMSGVTKGTDKLEQQLKELGLAADQVEDVIDTLGFEMGGVSSDMKDLAGGFNSFANTIGSLDFDTSDLEDALSTVSHAFSRSADEITRTAEEMVYNINDVLDGAHTHPSASSAPTIQVWVNGNDIIDTKKLDTRIMKMADNLIVMRTKRANIGTRAVM